MKVITIGRNPNNNVVIDDPKVSRHHLQIIQDDYGSFRIADFGSSNGTFVNGRRIYGEVALSENDIVRIGNTTVAWKQYFMQDDIVQPIVPTLTRSRHGFVTFWLWLMIVANFASMIVSPLLGHNVILSVVGGMIGITSAVLLLYWNKLGFWLFCAGAVLTAMSSIIMVVNGEVLLQNFSAPDIVLIIMLVIGSLLTVVILWAILQIRENGISCWGNLETSLDFPLPEQKTSNILLFVFISILFFVSSVDVLLSTLGVLTWIGAWGYIMRVLWIIFNISMILPAIAIRNNTLRIIGTVLALIYITFMMIRNVIWLLSL